MNTREKIIDIIAHLTNDETVRECLRDNDCLAQLDINSIKFISLVIELENEFDIEFEDEFLDYTQFHSLIRLGEYIESRMNIVQA